jgi:hypothetical protein
MAALHDPKMIRALMNGAHPALMWQIDHPNGMDYCWSGVGPLVFEGNTYKGIDRFGRVSQPEESADLAIKQGSIELRGVPPEQAAYLNTNIRNRRAKVLLAAVVNQKVIGTPFLFLDGRMDYMTMPVSDDGSVTIKVSLRVGFYSIERAQEKVWSHEQQMEDYPGDTGMSLISSLVDKEVKWRLTD